MIPLPAPSLEGKKSVEAALAGRHSVRDFDKSATLTKAHIGQLLWAVQGATHGRKKKTAPSAGALYPLEIYIVAGRVSGMSAGVYQYDAQRHGLDVVMDKDRREEVASACLRQAWIASAPAIIVIAAVYERSSAKYGSRAERYSHIEVGHCAQNIYLQAEALDLGTTMVGAFDDRRLQGVLGLASTERPLGVMPVGLPV